MPWRRGPAALGTGPVGIRLIPADAPGPCLVGAVSGITADIVGSVGRLDQQKNREVRRAAREVARQLDSATEGSYRPPDRDECRHKRWEMAYDDANSIRLQFLTWRKGAQLTEFVVNVEVLTAEGWEVIEYFDCCHGSYHLHPKSGEPREPIIRLDGVEDVQRAFAQVEREAHERARIVRSEGA